MSAVHYVWVIVSQKSGNVCFDSAGQLLVYKTQQDAILAMAKFMKTSSLELVLRKTKINLPWYRG